MAESFMCDFSNVCSCMVMHGNYPTSLGMGGGVRLHIFQVNEQMSQRNTIRFSFLGRT